MQGDFRIGDRTVVPTLNQILYEGNAVHVQPKAMRVLLHLAARRGEVAGREELIREVWPDTFVTDDVLKRCISDLRKALGDDHQTPRFIQTIPKVGYRLLTTVEPVEPQGDAGRSPAPVSRPSQPQQEMAEQSESQAAPSGAPVGHRSRRWWLALVASGVVLVGAASWGLRSHDLPEPHVVQLSSERFAAAATFSPDGRQIAFSSAGDSADNWDIWLKIVGEAETRRLTTDGAPDVWPAWGPDGKRIAFVRLAPSGSGAPPIATIYIVSPIGGAERRLLDFPVRTRGASLSWSPDGRWLAAAKAGDSTSFFGTGIYLIPAAGGDARQVTNPKPSVFDTSPAFSPDGSTLAYAACEGADPIYSCDVWTLSLDVEGRPRQEPRRLTWQGFPALTSLAWTRDGSSIIYSVWAARFSRLWRVRTDGSASPERVEIAGLGAVGPATVPCCDRLAYVRLAEDADIYLFQPDVGAAPLIASTVYDFNPQYSADGSRIAFTSSRADEREEVWLANADGSGATRLTRGPGRTQGSPRWSRDGLSIAFDSQAANGRWDIWTIGIDGSGLRQITRDPADENMPSWSHDGQFVYYGSNRSGRYEIWRIAVARGKEEQLTHAGGFLPFESRDGRTLYYLRARGGELLARPTAGGDERSIAACIDTWAYAVGPQGIFLVDCPAPGNGADAPEVLRHWDATTGQFRTVATLDMGRSGLILGLSASADGGRLIYSRYTPASDLMMIENFR
jgi:Tol biopolymer transport system component/DNA-binding winged helix-turn-helix (wHTH) protein